MTKAKTILALFFFLSFNSTSWAQVNITHTHLELNMQDIRSKRIVARAEISLKTGTTSPFFIRLGLSNDLKISQLTLDDSPRKFSHSNDELVINLTDVDKTKQSNTLVIYYSGTPAIDPSGWGGFYFINDFAFNLGVGFGSNPPSFGRAWFPASDDFVSKCTYSFHITTNITDMAVANGTLLNSKVKKQNNVWEYELKQPISSYLVGIAIGPYSQMNDTIFGSENKVQQIRLITAPSDSLQMKKTFANLKKCFQIFEEHYGPHQFDVIGFTLVPFENGAMEHPTNIAFPSLVIRNKERSERLMAHELSHHWWGNAITCSSPSDMWINEGFATFSEFLFLEKMYGKDAYNTAVANNHALVMRLAHINDDTSLSIHNPPFAATYGMHTYKKGADFVRSLRSIMGDSAFFKASKDLINSYKFKNLTSDDLLKVFSKHTPHNLSEIFKTWLYQPGFPHFEIVEISVMNESQKLIRVIVKQQTRFSDKIYAHLPVTLTLFDRYLVQEKLVLKLMKGLDTFYFNSTSLPVYAALDFENGLGNAVTDTNIFITNKTDSNIPLLLKPKNVFVDVQIENNGNEKSLLRIEHHWIAPTIVNTGQALPFVSNYRYWKIDGIWSTDMRAHFVFHYNASTDKKDPNSFLDHTLIRISEDSLVLVYRENSDEPWQILESAEYDHGDKHDKRGTIKVKDGKRGEYALAMFDPALSYLPSMMVKAPTLGISPNPAYTHVIFELPAEPRGGLLVITNAIGEKIQTHQTFYSQYELRIDTHDFNPGVYYATYYSQEGGMVRAQFRVERE